MSKAAGTTRRSCEQRTMRRLIAAQAVESLRTDAKRGSKSNAWKLTDDMLAALLVDDLEQLTVNESIDSSPDLAARIDVCSVSVKSISRWLADGRARYKTIRSKHNKELRTLGKRALLGADTDKLRKISSRTLLIAAMAQLEAAQPGELDPKDLTAIANAMKAAAGMDKAFAETDLKVLEADKITNTIEAARARIINDPSETYSTEQVDDALKAIGEEFRKLAEGESE